MPTTNAYTLEYWINSFRAQSNVISDFITKVAVSDGTTATFFMDESLLSKYHTELDEHKVSVNLSQREQHFYAYNPRLLSYDLYGAPEFWYLILYANEIYSAADFAPQRLKFYKSSVLNVLNTIRQLEMDRHNANEQECTDIITGNKSVNADILTAIV